MLTMPPALAALAEEPTFCLYKTAPSATKPGKLDKRPCNYLGEVADANDPRNHMTAERACQWAAHYGPPYGVAKVFPPGGRFFFLDIDNCLQSDGQWSPLAQTLMQRLTGCAIEVSASGRGLHIFGRGPVPEHGCRNTALGLELYTERAAKNFNRWGAHAATTYASKRGVSLNLLCMALGFEQRREKRNARSSSK